MKLDKDKQQQNFQKKYKCSKLRDVKTEAHPGPQTSLMENFPKIVNGFQSLTVVAMLSALYAYMQTPLFTNPIFTLYEEKVEVTPEVKGL